VIYHVKNTKRPTLGDRTNHQTGHQCRGVGLMSDSYEVIIRPDGGYSKEHAQMLRERLIADGFFGDVVSVKKSGNTGESE